jgi:hypothetical protein
VRTDKLVGAFPDRLEHRLHVVGRRGYHLENVGSCRLAFQRLLRLVEQPRVLDCDDRLVGKRFNQVDLSYRKWLYLATQQND